MNRYAYRQESIQRTFSAKGPRSPAGHAVDGQPHMKKPTNLEGADQPRPSATALFTDKPLECHIPASPIADAIKCRFCTAQATAISSSSSVIKRDPSSFSLGVMPMAIQTGEA